MPQHAAEALAEASPRPVERPAHLDPIRIVDLPRGQVMSAAGFAGCTPHEAQDVLRSNGLRPVWDPAAITRADTDRRAAEIAAADAALTATMEFADPSVGRSRMYGVNYLFGLAPLTSAYVLRGEPAYARAFERHFAHWYDSRHASSAGGGWPGLDAIWYSLGVWGRARTIVPALSVFGAAGELDDDVFVQMLATLVGGARWATDEHDVFRHGNWQLVCALELLHVAALLPEAPERGRWLQVALARWADHLELDFYPDGGHYERSPSYHHGMCLDALQRAAIVGEQYLGLDLTEHPRFAAAHHWLLDMSTPQGWVPHWQDSHLVRPATALLRGAYLLGDAELASAATRWLPPARIRAELACLPTRPGHGDPLVEFHGLVTSSPPYASTTSQNLRGSGYVVLRGDRGGDPYLALNAGPWADHELESHSHDAVLDIVVSQDGRPLVWEAGGPASYDDPRYYGWFQDGRSHSGVTIPGRALDHDRRVRVRRFETFAALDVVCATHCGYGRRVTRRIVAVRGALPYYVVVDDVAPGPDPWEAALLSPEPWAVRDGRFDAGDVAHGGAGLTVRCLGAQSWRTDTGPARMPPAGELPYHDLHALRLVPTGGRLITVLAPVRAGAPRSVTLSGDDSVWRICEGVTVDTVTVAGWCRRDGGGALVAACGWGDGDDGGGGNAGGAGPDGTLPAVRGEFVRRFEVAAREEFWASVVTSAATFVEIADAPPAGLTLNGVGIDTVGTAAGIRVALPCAGRWTLTAVGATGRAGAPPAGDIAEESGRGPEWVSTGS